MSLRATKSQFLILLMVFTPPVLLVLTFAMGDLPEFGAPALLLALFLIGWRMRRWTLKRLGGPPHVG